MALQSVDLVLSLSLTLSSGSGAALQAGAGGRPLSFTSPDRYQVKRVAAHAEATQPADWTYIQAQQDAHTPLRAQCREQRCAEYPSMDPEHKILQISI